MAGRTGPHGVRGYRVSRVCARRRRGALRQRGADRAGRVQGIRRRRPRGAANQGRGAPEERRTIVATAIIDGITTKYEVVGKGPPILMFSPGGFDATLDKWSTQSVYARIKLLDHLPKARRLHRFRLPRNGAVRRPGRAADMGELRRAGQGAARASRLAPRARDRRVHGVLRRCRAGVEVAADGRSTCAVLAGRRREVPDPGACSASTNTPRTSSSTAWRAW